MAPALVPLSLTTLVYKRLNAGKSVIDLNLDVYPPLAGALPKGVPVPTVPAVVYFHGGGLSVGNRRSWFPTWLHKRVTSAGYAFVSADYQLMPPATGHDILRDIRDLWAFVTSGREIIFPSDKDPGTSQSQPFRFKIDADAIAVAGTSSGGLCALLAAMHCDSPRPKAVISMYGMGCNFLVPLYLSPKTRPFFRGGDLVNPPDFQAYLHSIHLPPGSSVSYVPYPRSLPIITGSPLEFHPNTYRIPRNPINRRMLLSRLYMQLGIFLDFYTGSFEGVGLSAHLRKTLGFENYEGTNSPSGPPRTDDYLRSLLPLNSLALFPQFGVTEKWPPTMLVNGTHDTGVSMEEPRSLARKLAAAGVEVRACEVEGRDHSFDYEPNAEELFGGVFSAVMDFLTIHLSRKGVRVGLTGDRPNQRSLL